MDILLEQSSQCKIVSSASRLSFSPCTHVHCTQEFLSITGNLDEYFQKILVFISYWWNPLVLPNSLKLRQYVSIWFVQHCLIYLEFFFISQEICALTTQYAGSQELKDALLLMKNELRNLKFQKSSYISQKLISIPLIFWANHFQKTSSLNVNCVEKFADNKKCSRSTRCELGAHAKFWNPTATPSGF